MCNHILGTLDNPLSKDKPVTIILEDRLGVVQALVGPENHYVLHHLNQFDKCPTCGTNIEDIWDMINRDAVVLRTNLLTPEIFDANLNGV